MKEFNKNYYVTWLRLAWTKGIGCKNFWASLEKYENLEDILEIISKKGYEIPSNAFIQDQITSYTKKGVDILCAFQDDFPKNLKNIDLCPPVLFFKGNKELLMDRIFGVVGARNVSLYGRKITHTITNELQYHFKIISGFARGVDTTAHEASLKSGTIAVFAGGIDVIYPIENQKLYDAILANGGLIISERFLGAQPTASSFPARNRIIAGIVEGILVVEAAYKSGSLITAQFAGDFGKDVFVIPGSPLDPRNRGSHKLLKEGAILTEDVSDIMRHYGQAFVQNYKISPAKHSCFIVQELYQKVLDNLGLDFIEPEELLNVLEIDFNLLSKILSELEIEGMIIRDIQGKICLKNQ